MDNNSLAHTKWNCKYHIVFAPKIRRKEIYGKLKADLGKYYEDDVMITDQISIKEYTRLNKQKNIWIHLRKSNGIASVGINMSLEGLQIK